MYSMVNLVAGERVVEELIQDRCTPEAVAQSTVELLTNEDRVIEMKEQLAVVRERLGGPGASGRAADAVLALVRSRSGQTGAGSPAAGAAKESRQ
jgi:lipid-A-disaccharide synthase